MIVFDANDQFHTLEAVSLADVERALEEGKREFRIVPDQPAEDFEALVSMLDQGRWEWADYVLIVDESSFVQRPQVISPALERLIRQAPADVDVIETSHRPADTHSLVKGLATDVFVFQTYLDRDLRYLADNFGDEVAESAARLGRHQVLHWWLDVGGAPRMALWDDHRAWYVPLREEGIDGGRATA